VLRFLDGFDLTDNPDLKYSPVLPFVLQTSISGRDGKGLAFNPYSSGGADDVWWKILDVKTRWNIGFDICWLNEFVSTTLAGTDFYWCAAGSTVVFSLAAATDGRLVARAGRQEDGAAVLATSVNPLIQASSVALGQPNIWQLIEIQVGGGSFEVRWEGNPVLSGTSSLLTGIDRHAFVLKTSGLGGGFAIDNYWICDDQPGLSGFQGRSRITSVAPIQSNGAQWILAAGTSLVDAVTDTHGNQPDGDVSYIIPHAIGSFQQYQLAKPPCYGLILGLALNLCAKPPGLGTKLSGRISRSSNVFSLAPAFDIVDSGSSLSSNAQVHGYRTYQAISETNPQNGLVWNDGDLAAALWGPYAENATGVRVTQVYLEKLVTLNVSRRFNCGQGLYVF